MFQSNTPPLRITGSKSVLPLKAAIVKERTTKRKKMKMRMTKRAKDRTNVASQKKHQKTKRKLICVEPNKSANKLIRKVRDATILSR